MTALPTGQSGGAGVTYNTRGTLGTPTDNTTVRYDQARLIHYLYKNLNFFNQDWMVTVDIPEHQNELVHFDIDLAPTGAAYQIDEFGKQTAGTNSIGAAQTANADVPGITLNMTYVEFKPKRWALVSYWTAVNRSVSKRDPVAKATREMGLVAAQHLDNLTKGGFDTYAQDYYPLANLTSDTDADWGTAGAAGQFSYTFLVKLEAAIKNAGLRPPGGGKEYPFILPYDAIANLLVDPNSAQILRDTAQRGSPMAGPFAEGYMGSLRSFALIGTNNLPTVTAFGTGGTLQGNRGYIFTDEAIGCLAMQSDAYGTGPDTTHEGMDGHGWDEMPRPVQVYNIEPGTSGIADVFKNLGATAGKYTIGIQSLVAGRLVRVSFLSGTVSDYGIGRAGTVGTF